MNEGVMMLLLLRKNGMQYNHAMSFTDDDAFHYQQIKVENRRGGDRHEE